MIGEIIGFCIWVYWRDGKFQVEVVSLRELVRRLRRMSLLRRLTTER